jgi:hypothetical protein
MPVLLARSGSESLTDQVPDPTIFKQFTGTYIFFIFIILVSGNELNADPNLRKFLSVPEQTLKKNYRHQS